VLIDLFYLPFKNGYSNFYKTHRTHLQDGSRRILPLRFSERNHRFEKFSHEDIFSLEKQQKSISIKKSLEIFIKNSRLFEFKLIDRGGTRHYRTIV